MTEGGYWTIIVLILYLVSTVWTRLECRPEAVRQLNTSDVAASSIENGPFLTLSGILLGDTGYYWYSSGIPNTGKLNFTETFVLMGLSTQGHYFPDIMDERYVSSFSLEYAGSLNESYHDDIKVFNVSNGVERFFYFSEPILARTLQLVILDAYVGIFFPYRYYWYLDIIGCPETEAVEVVEPSSCQYPTPTMSTFVIESCVTPSNHQVTFESVKMDTQSQPVCSCEILASLTTEYNNGATIAQLTQTPSPLEQSCDVQLVVAIVPTIVLLIVLAGIILLWILVVNFKRCCKRSKGEAVLRDFRNTDLYLSHTLKRNDYQESQNGDMVYNDLYTKPRDDPEENDEQDMIYNDIYTRAAIGDSLNSDDTEDPAHYSEVGVYSDISPKREELDESVGEAENRYNVGSVPMTTNDAYNRIN